MDYDEAKAEVMRLHPAQVHAARVAQLANRATAEAGFVMWEAMPPANSNWVQHKESFSDAIYTALGFCLSEFRNEWLVLGRVGAVLIRSLAKFKESEGVLCYPTRLIYMGQLGIIAVYMDSTLPTEDFLAGVLTGKTEDKLLCCRGLIRNSPVTFTDRHVEPLPIGLVGHPALYDVPTPTEEEDDDAVVANPHTFVEAGDDIIFNPATLQPEIVRHFRSRA